MNKNWPPAICTFMVLVLILSIVIINSDGDPLVLVRIGTRFSQGLSDGSDGYDGQFVYYIAQDLNPTSVADHLDVPAYRYQRILLPFLARLLSLGNTAALPWVLAAIGVFSQTLGTWGVGVLLNKWGINSWYALVYGLWVGFILSVRLVLPESLAYALVIAAILAQIDRRYVLSAILYALALFAKDIVLFFVVAQGLLYLWKKDIHRAVQFGLIAILPFALFQVWLYFVFGSFGIGLGGEGATPFELIPLMGFWRIWEYSSKLLIANILVFGPALLLPAIWGAWMVVKKILQRDIDFLTVALTIQVLLIITLPFAVAREPGGLLRFSCGLVTALLLFSAKNKHMRALKYMPLWMVLNVFLVKG